MANSEINEGVNDVEITEERGDAVPDSRAGSSNDSMSGEVKEKGEEMAKVQERVKMLENEAQRLKTEVAEIDEEIDARIEAKMGGEWLDEEEQPPAVIRLSDWTRTQIRSLETHIGRVRRETSDCR